MQKHRFGTHNVHYSTDGRHVYVPQQMDSAYEGRNGSHGGHDGRGDTGGYYNNDRYGNANGECEGIKLTESLIIMHI